MNVLNIPRILALCYVLKHFLQQGFSPGPLQGEYTHPLKCAYSITCPRNGPVISFVRRSFGGTWYTHILASICDFCMYRIQLSFELSPNLTLLTCEQRMLCRDFVCAQVRKIYMKTELQQCVLSRSFHVAAYFIFHQDRMVHYSGGFRGGSL